MKRKLIICNTVIIALALLLMFGLSTLVTRDNNYEQAEEKIIQLTKVYVSTHSEDIDYSKKVDDNVRITIVDSTGKVISDSDMKDISAAGNHIDRDEIKAAEKGKPKTFIRYSSTLDKNMIYYAEKVEVDDSYFFIRVAIPIENVNSYIGKTIPLLLGILTIALVISFVASMGLGNGLLKPLTGVKRSLQNVASGNYVTEMPTTHDSDINEIITDINGINETLRSTIASARDDKQKLDYIINNVTDGIVVFGDDGKVSLINKKAQDIFGIVEALGKEAVALTSNKRITKGITRCIEQKNSSIFETKINEQVFLCAVKYTDNDLVIAVFSDITASRNNEKMRSEFFANASHELKTPLTSIKGFNEMIALKSKDKEVQAYSDKITRGSSRMLTLINDMLNLSKLENTTELHKTDVDVKEVADEVADGLVTLAEKKNVSIIVSGNGTLSAEREHVFELIKNLVENAIRYNNNGGKVDISIQTLPKKITLTVSDNGIGIDDEHQSRIFERFYRVDKSRSRETGGTGLGLSIVKHIAELYNADLKLTSKLGVGTEIKISFSID